MKYNVIIGSNDDYQIIQLFKIVQSFFPGPVHSEKKRMDRIEKLILPHYNNIVILNGQNFDPNSLFEILTPEKFAACHILVLGNQLIRDADEKMKAAIQHVAYPVESEQVRMALYKAIVKFELKHSEGANLNLDSILN